MDTLILSCFQKVLNSCRTVAIHPMCEISKENLEVFMETWSLLCQDVISIYKEISELCRRDIQYKTVYMSLPRPGVSFPTISFIHFNYLLNIQSLFIY